MNFIWGEAGHEKKSWENSREQEPLNDREGSWENDWNLWICKRSRSVTWSRYHEKPWTIIVLKAKCKNSQNINKYAKKRFMAKRGKETKTFQNNQIRTYRKQIASGSSRIFERKVESHCKFWAREHLNLELSPSFFQCFIAWALLNRQNLAVKIYLNKELCIPYLRKNLWVQH